MQKSRQGKAIMAAMLMAGCMSACDTVDCSLENIVLCRYGFYDSQTGKSIAVTDTMTITAEGTDSVLFNKGMGKTGVQLPMSYGRDADTLHFTFTGDGYSNSMSLQVIKENSLHFDSPDCPTNMFHRLKEVNVLGMCYIVDSVIISKPTVNYETAENIKIYFRTAD